MLSKSSTLFCFYRVVSALFLAFSALRQWIAFAARSFRWSERLPREAFDGLSGCREKLSMV